MLRFARLFPALVLLAGCVGSPAISPPSAGLSPAAGLSQLSGPRCPRYRKGTGILSDGDLHQSADPGGGYLTFSKGQYLAPSWKVTVLNINVIGTTFWNFDHLCSVDLDGESAVGGIEHHAFATQKGAAYTLSFLMSGNSYCGAAVKIMRVSAGDKDVIFRWNVSNGNSAENGKFAPRHLNFTATSANTTLKFTSLDAAGSGCGPVIGALSVTKV